MFLKGKSYKKLTDEELILKYRSTSNSKWVGTLFERYAHLVYGSCLKYLKDEALAKDQVMQVFEKLLAELKTQEVRSFKSWLFIVTRNECLMELRRMNKSAKSLSDVSHHSEDDDYDFEREELLTQLEQSLDLLKEEQAICLRLFYFQKKSYDEISEDTGESVKQVKSHLQNGRRNLKIIMNKKYGRA